MSSQELLLLGLLGVVAGVCNTLAGGGSLFIVPTMIFLGLPATAANATLRPAILVQNVLALFGFYRGGVLDRDFFRRGVVLISLSVPAALVAAQLVTTRVNDEEFEFVLGLVFLGLALFMAWQRRPGRQPEAPIWVGWLLMLAAGFYGGFVQAGVGFILVTALVPATHWPMARIHAAKVAIVLVYTAATLPVFVLAGTIDWRAAAVLAAAQGAGGFIGSRLAIRVSDTLLRRIYILFMLLFAMLLLLR